MYKIALYCLLTLALSACSLFQLHKSEVEQGNVITSKELHRLHTGMTESQVKDVMGTPTLVNLFTPHRVEYIYTYQLGNNPRTEKRVTLMFEHGRLREIL